MTSSKKGAGHRPRRTVTLVAMEMGLTAPGTTVWPSAVPLIPSLSPLHSEEVRGWVRMPKHRVGGGKRIPDW